jgi:hypothetical protein
MEAPRKKQKTGTAVLVSASQQQRERALRHWFYNAKSADSATREQAQARMQLQLQLRAYRKAIDKWEGKLRDAERSGNRPAFEKFDARRVENVKQLHIWTSILRTSISLKDDNKRKTEVLLAGWDQNPCVSLDKLSQDAKWDKPQDFPHDPTLHICDTTWSQRHCGPQTLQEEEDREDTMEVVSTTGVRKDHIDTRPAELQASEFESNTISSSTWNRYHCSMIKRYIAAGIPLSFATANLAMQKEVFECHAQLELDVRTAHANTSFMTADKSRIFLANKTTRMRTGRVRNRGVWKLASTKLWSYVENADYLRYTPGGYLHIATSESGLSVIHLDFGHRNFEVGDIALPEYVRTHPLPLKATCLETLEDVFMGLTPLANGFLKIHMSALAMVPVDKNSEIPPPWASDVIELVGVCADDLN